MTPNAPLAPCAPPKLADIYQRLDGELTEIGSLIRGSLTHDDPVIRGVLDYSLRLGGKRLRPLLVLLCGEASGELRREHLLAAAALEMIHTGTLIHDDILDGALVRRHLETVNLRWDSRMAVLIGDYLLTCALSLITECGDLDCDRMIADACRVTCEGELRQVTSIGDFEMTEADYFKIVEGKTASLLECSCRIGAHFSNAPQTAVESFARFGRKLGAAFQILDDVLDLVGDSEKMGKTLGTDLVNRKPTLPLIRWLAEAESGEKRQMLALLTQGDFDEEKIAAVCRRLNEQGAIDSSRRTAFEMVESGLAALDGIITPEKTAVLAEIERVARFVLSRNS